MFCLVYQGNLFTGMQKTVFEKPLSDLEDAVNDIGELYTSKIMREKYIEKNITSILNFLYLI